MDPSLPARHHMRIHRHTTEHTVFRGNPEIHHIHAKRMELCIPLANIPTRLFIVPHLSWNVLRHEAHAKAQSGQTQIQSCHKKI